MDEVEVILAAQQPLKIGENLRRLLKCGIVMVPDHHLLTTPVSQIEPRRVIQSQHGAGISSTCKIINSKNMGRT